MKNNDFQYTIDRLKSLRDSTHSVFKDEISQEIVEILTTAIFHIEKLKPKPQKKDLFTRTAQFFIRNPK